MSDTITLQNRVRRPHQIILRHEVICAAAEHCKCTRQLVGTTLPNNKDGSKKVVPLKRRMAHTVTLWPRGMEGDTIAIHPAALQLPDIQTLLKRGEVVQLSAEQVQALADKAKAQKAAADKVAAARKATAEAKRAPAAAPAETPATHQE